MEHLSRYLALMEGYASSPFMVYIESKEQSKDRKLKLGNLIISQ